MLHNVGSSLLCVNIADRILVLSFEVLLQFTENVKTPFGHTGNDILREFKSFDFSDNLHESFIPSRMALRVEWKLETASFVVLNCKPVLCFTSLR